VEHRQDRPLMRVDSRSCVGCHGALASRRPGGAAIATTITAFADHPEFTPLRDGDGGAANADPTKLRFNHKAHLTSSEIAEPLVCANCHQPEHDGRDMTTSAFERYAARAGEEAAVWLGDLTRGPFPRQEAGGGQKEVGEDDVGPEAAEGEAPARVPMIYCRKCHAQNVKEVPAPFSEVEAPHASPQVIRVYLERDVVALGVERAKTIFESDQIRLPGRVPRVAVDSESKTWAEFEDRWVGAIEAELYRPLRAAPAGGSLFENNKYCFLCHERSDAADGPQVVPPAIPARWLRHAQFSHRMHDKVECAECHGDLKQSAATAEVNLPKREVCEKCHRADEARSAGTECILCHLYHDTSKDPVKRERLQKEIVIEVLTGDKRPD
jgi:hypothetical protein